MARRIKVIYRKLGREKSWGWAHTEGNFIEVDERAKGKKKLELLIHESAHLLWPADTEEQIERKAAILTHTLWHEGARIVDNENETPMQDGSI
jgi:hypothetical protein